MTVKDASLKFKLDEKEIRKRKNDNMILGVEKEGRNIYIPDDTKIIPSKAEIKSFLFQIIKYKNNSATVISRTLCPSRENLEIMADYLYRKGFIGKYSDFNGEENFFDTVKLTDEGLAFVFGKTVISKYSNHIPFTIQINPTFTVFNV